MMKKVLCSLCQLRSKSTFGAPRAFFALCLALSLVSGHAGAQLKGKTAPVPGSAPAKPEPPQRPATPAAPEEDQGRAAPKAGSTVPTTPATPSAPAANTPEIPAFDGLRLNADLPILLLALDEVDLRQGGESTSGSARNTLEKQLVTTEIDISDRPPGRAQAVAAPLRRILLGVGATDVLNTALDGAPIVRAQNAGRISARVVNATRSAIFRIQTQFLQSGETPLEISPALQEDAITAMMRIGQALGYRAIVAVVAPLTSSSNGLNGLLVIVDSQEQNGQIIPVSVPGEATADKLAAASGALLLPRLSKWSANSVAKMQEQAEGYLKAAQDAASRGDLPAAQDYINQVVGLQPSNAKAYALLGDLLQQAAPRAAANAYMSALSIASDNGALWAKLAFIYTTGDHPNWPGALEAAQKALSNGFESALLRTVMASAEFGRAQIFSKAGRTDQADLANRQAKDYLDMAMRLLPRDNSITAEETRMIASNLIAAQRFDEASSLLDTAARKYPADVEMQRLYAQALSNTKGRTEDAFVAQVAVWKLEGSETIPLDAQAYTDLTDGFDKHVFNLARAASMLTSAVANRSMPAATALPQVQQYAASLKDSVDALRLMQPPAGRLTTSVHASRLIAADMFLQAVQSYALYLQNGNQDVLAHGGQLHYQAIDRLNAVRKAG